jgi:hypothetical protein
MTPGLFGPHFLVEHKRFVASGGVESTSSQVSTHYKIHHIFIIDYFVLINKQASTHTNSLSEHITGPGWTVLTALKHRFPTKTNYYSATMMMLIKSTTTAVFALVLLIGCLVTRSAHAFAPTIGSTTIYNARATTSSPSSSSTTTTTHLVGRMVVVAAASALPVEGTDAPDDNQDPFDNYQQSPEQTTVAIKDSVVGTGYLVGETPGQLLTVAYKGRFMADGKLFDQSDSFVCRLGKNKVLPGFEEGLMVRYIYVSLVSFSVM